MHLIQYDLRNRRHALHPSCDSVSTKTPSRRLMRQGQYGRGHSSPAAIDSEASSETVTLAPSRLQLPKTIHRTPPPSGQQQHFSANCQVPPMSQFSEEGIAGQHTDGESERRHDGPIRRHAVSYTTSWVPNFCVLYRHFVVELALGVRKS